MNWDRLLHQLKFDEGFRKYPYDDATGFEVKAPVGVLTIGWGTKIEGDGIDTSLAETLLIDRVRTAIEDCNILFRDFLDVDDLRQEALINMAYNLGRTKLKKFKNMCGAVNSRDWERAAAEAEDSKWFKQVKARGERIVKVLKDG